MVSRSSQEAKDLAPQNEAEAIVQTPPASPSSSRRGTVASKEPATLQDALSDLPPGIGNRVETRNMKSRRLAQEKQTATISGTSLSTPPCMPAVHSYGRECPRRLEGHPEWKRLEGGRRRTFVFVNTQSRRRCQKKKRCRSRAPQERNFAPRLEKTSCETGR